MNRTGLTIIFVALFSVALGGCGSAPTRELSQESIPYTVLVTGKDPLDPTQFVQKVGTVYASDEDLIRYYEEQRGHALNILLLSGGGQNGAFGAGLLNGWQASGTRPEFDVVTGVSTGALLATHAFLGTPADDAVLKQIFTGVNQDDIYTKRSPLSVLGGADSLLNTDALEEFIEQTITEEVLARVAAEQAKGRRLLVGTTNLDYNQTWAWNLGLIASEGTPEALELYRKVLRASSAFPIMFPPVEIGGHLFADGAVRANILVIGLSGGEAPGPAIHGTGTIYVVQNGRATQGPAVVQRNLVSIASATIGEMMASSNYGLLMRAYIAARMHDYDFRTVAVPDGVDIGTNPLAFDQAQMQAGYDAGVQLGSRHASWSGVPPMIGDIPEWAVDVLNENL